MKRKPGLRQGKLRRGRLPAEEEIPGEERRKPLLESEGKKKGKYKKGAETGKKERRVSGRAAGEACVRQGSFLLARARLPSFLRRLPMEWIVWRGLPVCL